MPHTSLLHNARRAGGGLVMVVVVVVVMDVVPPFPIFLEKCGNQVKMMCQKHGCKGLGRIGSYECVTMRVDYVS